MKRRFTVWRRAIGAVVLVLGATVTAVLPLADAHAEEASVTASPHVEAQGSTNCAPVHNDQACQLCRVLRLPGNGAPHAADLAVALAPERAPVHDAETPPPERLAGSVSPRAPPVA